MPVAPELPASLLALPFLVLLGMAPAWRMAAPPSGAWHRHDSARLIAIAAAAGLLINYLLALALHRLRVVLVVDMLIVTATVAWLVRGRRLGAVLGLGWPRWTLIVAVIAFFLGVILLESLRAWDARSIWFFHGKVIYYARSLADVAAWQNPVHGLSHPDYPKLLPLLAAQVAQMARLWNEYVPKAALLALLLPVACGLAAIAGPRLRASLLLPAGVLLFVPGDLLWNGYADAYLAAYAVLGLLFAARWIESRETPDACASLLFLGLALSLKNEGLLIALCAGGVLALGSFARDRRLRFAWPARPVVMAAVIVLAALVGWLAHRAIWRLPNDLDLGLGSLVRAAQRLQQGELPFLVHFLLVKAHVLEALVVLAAAMLALRLGGGRQRASHWYPAAVATVYGLGLSFIYLATPHGLQWHLETSAVRTMLPVVGGYLSTAFLALSALEAQPAPAAQPQGAGVPT